MSAKNMTLAQEMRVDADLAEEIQRSLGLSATPEDFKRPSWRREFNRFLEGLIEGRRQASAKAAAHRLANDDFDDDDPIRRAYPGESGGAYAEPLDEGGGVHVEDDDDDWQDGGDAAAASVDKFFPKRKGDSKSDDAPRATPKAAGGPKASPMERLLRTSDSSGKPDHEPADGGRRSALSRFLEKRKK